MHARNLHRIRPVTRSLLFGAGVALLATGCLDRNGGQVSTGFVGLTTTDGTTTAGASSSTTLPGIMTSTFEPVDTTEDGTTDDTASTGTTGEPIPAGCGNGKLDEGEHCDDGEGNGDDAPCTSACTLNVCGDGYVLAGKEVCDDGPDNGKYEHCAADCQDLGARCGDAVLQMEDGEECDGATPADGCLRDCKLATTCIEIMDSWGDEVSDGVHIIHRGGDVLQVWCAMEADGGGYTMLKYAATDPDNPEYFSAKKAEQRCGEYGMRLVVPRSEAHLASIAEAASAVEFGPANNGLPNDTAAYLRLFGIYPYQEGESCVGVLL